MKAFVIGFAGKVGSGKSTLSSSVANQLGWQRVSFGAYVRKVARERGIDDCVGRLQDLGAELVAKDRWQLCQDVLASADWKPGEPLIIDGIRHVEVLQTISSLVQPSKLLLVFVVASESTRADRLRKRGVEGIEEVERIDSHSTEEQVGTVLRELADLVVDGESPVEDAVRGIVGWIRRLSE